MTNKNELVARARKSALEVAHLWTHPSARMRARTMQFLQSGQWYDRDQCWSSAAWYVDKASYDAACALCDKGADYYAARAARCAATELDFFTEETVDATIDAATMAKALVAKASAHPEGAWEAFWVVRRNECERMEHNG
jgi:hypothetical protein